MSQRKYSGNWPLLRVEGKRAIAAGKGVDTLSTELASFKASHSRMKQVAACSEVEIDKTQADL